MSHSTSCRICSSHRGRRCPSFLSSHECDKTNKQAPSPRSKPATNVLLKRPYLHAAGASLHRPKYSIKRFNLHVAFALHVMGVEFRPSSSSHAYDKQVAPPARSTGHQLSTPSTALFMVHARKARMGIDALYVLSWHHGTGTYSSLFSSKGFTKIYLNCFILEPICYYIYTYGYIVNMGAS